MSSEHAEDAAPSAFERALRAELTRRVGRTRNHRWRWAVWGGGIAVVALGGIGAAAASGDWLGGTPIVDSLGVPLTITISEDGELALGPAPEGANGVVIDGVCRTAGSIFFPGGAMSEALDISTGGGSVHCTESDAGSSAFSTGPFGPSTEQLASGRFALDVEGTWQVTGTWISVGIAPFPVNANGDTYGSSAYGSPVLVAVGFDLADGSTGLGYVYGVDLDPPGPANPEEAATWVGEPMLAPIYLSDGETVIGVWTGTGRALRPDEAPPSRPWWSTGGASPAPTHRPSPTS